ncbi:Solute carrier family 2, facilitated glucose transporter member 7 [Plecturocebus cupreus]
MLLFTTLSSAFGSAFQYGYNLAVVNTPHKVGTRRAGQQLTRVMGGRQRPSSSMEAAILPHGGRHLASWRRHLVLVPWMPTPGDQGVAGETRSRYVDQVFKSFYNETYFERHGTFMDEKFMLILWSCTVAMFPLGGLLGSLIVGLLVDSCGRKGTLLINNIFAIVPAILMGVSKVAKAFELIIFSRVVLGVCAVRQVICALEESENGPKQKIYG